MKLIIITILVFVLTFNLSIFSQNTDICEVYSVNVKTEKEIKLGSFTTNVSEGFSIHKPFKIPKTKLYLVAGINYDDDLFEENKQILTDAIHLKLLITSEQKLNKENIENVKPLLILSLTETIIKHKSDDIYPIVISLFFKTQFRKQVFYMNCKQNTRLK